MISAVTLIIFGSALITVGSISYHHYHNLVDSFGLFFYLIIIMIGLFSVFISLIGIIGSKRQDRCLLGVFNIFLFNLTLILFLITFVLLYEGTFYRFVLSQPDSNQVLNDCETSKHSKILHDIAAAAEQQFCSENCICYIQNASAWTSGSLNNFTYTPYPQIPHNIYQFQQCKDFNFQDEAAQVNYLANLEERFNCAGWCYNSPIFLFTNVNRGQPNENCFVTYASEIGQRLIGLSYFTLAISFLLTTEVVMSCCYQFHPERDPKKQRLYKLIKYFED